MGAHQCKFRHYDSYTAARICFCLFHQRSREIWRCSAGCDAHSASNHGVYRVLFDGFAYVAETETGQSYGAKDKSLFAAALHKTTVLAGITAATLAVLVAIAGGALVKLMTDLTDVVVLSKVLLPICAVYVFASFPAFQLDGVFIGTSRTKEMRDASILSVMSFFCWRFGCFSEALGLAGLWWAMVVFVVARALSLWIYFARVTERFSQVA